MPIRLALLVLLLIALVALPFLYAASAAGADFVFGGFLFNPVDGATYLAKLYQGWRGEWRFTLPYTAEPGQGAFLYLFYLALGHLARLLHLPLIWTLHLARLISAVLLALSLYQFLIRPLDSRAHPGKLFALALFGAGLGWLAYPFGAFISDFWVAEAYPFLSAYSSAHFCLGLALLLWLLRFAIEGKPFIWLVLLAFFLSIVNPFGVVIALAALGSLVAWDFISNLKCDKPVDTNLRSLPAWLARLPVSLPSFLWVLLGGSPLVFYAFFVFSTDPVMMGWNAQNLTPSPPLWDLLLSISPALLLAGWGAWLAFRRGDRRAHLLALWLVVDLALLYLPLDLQRRLMTGLFVPVVGLAGIAVEHWMARSELRARLALTACLILSLPTNLLVLMAAFSGIQSHNLLPYLLTREAQALDWIEANTPERALVLASPEVGLWIPARTGRRVVYGHPFETVNAEVEKTAVTAFFAGGLPDAAQFLKERQIDYIFYGPREHALGVLPLLPGWQPVYQSDGITIYAVADH